MKNHRRYLSSALALSGLVALAGPSSPALIGPGGSRSMRFNTGAEPTVEELKAQLAEANTRLGQYADYDTLKKEHGDQAKRLKEIEDKGKTEAQRLADQAKADADRANAAELRAKATEARLAVERKARQLGVVDEDAAYRLLDASKIEFADDGTPKNIDALLDQLVKEKPFLLGSGSGGGGGTGGGSGNAHNPGRNRGGGLTLEQIKQMTPAQINANLDAVNAALAAAGK